MASRVKPPCPAVKVFTTKFQILENLCILSYLLSEPIRQNSTPESRHQEPASIQSYGGYSEPHNHDPSHELYMYDLGSDSLNSYALVHAEHPPSDVGNLDDLHSLDPTSIGSRSSARSQPQPSDSVVSNTEMFDNETHEREGPEGCSLQQSCGNDNDSYRHRPDLQRTYSKTVEVSEETNLADSIARNLRGETFVKKSDNSDSKANDKGNTVSACNFEFDDDLDKEKLKNQEMQGNANHYDAVVESKDGKLGTEEETEVCKGDKNKDSSENETEEERVKESDSSNDNDTEVGADSDASVEVDIDCLASNETGTANADSVELPIDIGYQLSDSTTDSMDDCTEGNQIDEGIRRRES